MATGYPDNICMTFEWDPRKAAENLAKHGILSTMRRGSLMIRIILNRKIRQTSIEEARYHAIGMVENLLLFVTFTYRQDTIRLISA